MAEQNYTTDNTPLQLPREPLPNNRKNRRGHSVQSAGKPIGPKRIIPPLLLIASLGGCGILAAKFTEEILNPSNPANTSTATSAEIFLSEQPTTTTITPITPKSFSDSINEKLVETLNTQVCTDHGLTINIQTKLLGLSMRNADQAAIVKNLFKPEDIEKSLISLEINLPTDYKVQESDITTLAKEEVFKMIDSFPNLGNLATCRLKPAQPQEQEQEQDSETSLEYTTKLPSATDTRVANRPDTSQMRF